MTKEVYINSTEDNSDSGSTLVNQTSIENEVKHHSFPVEQELYQLLTLNTSRIEASKKLLENFVKQEQLIQKRSEAKNKLEGLIYLVGEKVGDDEFTKYLSEEDQSRLR